MARKLGPGLDGWFAADEAARQQNSSQLQQMGGLLQLQGILQKQQQEQAYRGALSQAQTPEEQLAVATKFGGPEAVMRHADRMSQIKATKETALARITETARNTDSQIAHRLAQETDSKKRLELEAMRDAARNYYNKQSLAISGEKLFYETGTRLPIEPAPQLGVQAAPNAAPQQGVLRTTAPTDAQALQLVQDADRQGLGASVGVTGSPTMPQAAPVTQPPPVPTYPGDPNADAQDRRIAAQARMAPAGVPAPIPSAAVTAPVGGGGGTVSIGTTPLPPNIRSLIDAEPSPRKKREIEQRYRMMEAQKGIGVNLAGGRESVFINRIILSGNQAAADLTNVAKLPLTEASTGIFGGRGQPKGIFNAGKETLANTMTTQEVQKYNVLATGFQRSLAAIEASGLAPQMGLMHQMDAVLFKEGDTNLTKLYKLAQTRQIIEKGLESTSANPRVAQETKTHIDDVVERVRKAVPFTIADLHELESRQQTNPNITLGDVVKLKNAGQGGWTADKEKRYQELLRKQSGS